MNEHDNENVFDIKDMSIYYGKSNKNKSSDDSIKAYLEEIISYPLLSYEEEVKYGKIIADNTELLNEYKDIIDVIDDEEIIAYLKYRIKEKEKELSNLYKETKDLLTQLIEIKKVSKKSKKHL